MAAEYRLRVLLRPEVPTDGVGRLDWRITKAEHTLAGRPRASARRATSPRSKQNNSSTLYNLYHTRKLHAHSRTGLRGRPFPCTARGGIIPAGGFFNHPADPGGITNYLVSLMFLKSLSLVDADIDGDGNPERPPRIDADDVRGITPQTVRALFRKYFWDAPRVAELSPLIALIT